MIIVSNLQILNSVDTLKYLNEQSLPIKTSFQIAHLIKKLNGILGVINSEKEKIIFKWAVKNDKDEIIKPADSNGNPIEDQIVIKDINQFQIEIEQLYNINNDIEFNKIKYDEFGSVVISPSMISCLDWLIEI